MHASRYAVKVVIMHSYQQSSIFMMYNILKIKYKKEQYQSKIL